MKTLLIIILFFSFSFVGLAQEKVQVLDKETNQPLGNATVLWNQKKSGTTTDNEGFFYFKNLPHISLKDTLHFSYIGYVAQTILVSDIKSQNYIVYLVSKPQTLEQVTITGNKSDLNRSIPFQELAPLKHGLFSFGAALVDNKIYVIGGDNTIKEARVSPSREPYKWENSSNQLQIYDIESDSWYRSDLKFVRRAYHSVHYSDGKIYVLGGKRYGRNKRIEFLNNEVEAYDIKRDTIYTSKINPHQAANFASVIYDDNIIILGGSTKEYINKKRFSNKIHSWNLKTGYWYELGEIPYPKETKGVIVDSTIYLIGGFTTCKLIFIDTYNISSGEYKTIAKLPLSFERPALVYDDQDTIYIFENSWFVAYNIKTNTMTGFRIMIHLTSSEMFLKDGKIYILGGVFNSEGDEAIQPSDRLFSIDLNDLKKTQRVSIVLDSL